MMRRRIRHPLVRFYGAALVLAVAFWLLPDRVTHITDLLTVTIVSIVYLWAMALMLSRTRLWTKRGMGFLGTVTGDAALYTSLGLGVVAGMLGIDVGFRSLLVDLARAFLLVGGLLLLVGLRRVQREVPS